MSYLKSRAFTLVEILIVVVILGILAAIAVPQFASATGEAQQVATLDQLQKVRSALAVYYLQNGSRYPRVTAGEGTWGELLTLSYMRAAPVNSWIGTGNSKAVVLGSEADTAFQTAHGWIYQAGYGNVWAGSFNSQDEAFPRP
ncbi:MAG: type II secretion system protein [Phycisphaerales bacterium]